MSLGATLGAQVAAETKMRLRSAATPIALLVFLAASFFWIPDPSGRSVAISWTTAEGRIQSPVYTSDFLGFAVALLSGLFLSLAGFYLVAGSVRRDRERNVGAILAATPLSKGAYLGGKFAAHFAYLSVVSALALVAGIVAFARYGVGPFRPFDFLVPFLLLTVPAMAWVAALAILFDVTPGLRGRGGLVLWFFVFAFGLVKIPSDLAGGFEGPVDRSAPASRPVFDPAGFASEQVRIRESLPPGAKDVSAGHITHTAPVEHVPWKAKRPGADVVGLRAGNLLLAGAPLLLAIAIFDRFDPARWRGLRKARTGRAERRAAEEIAPAPAAREVKLSPVHPRPSAARAIAAEARLVFESASWIKWPLVLAAVVAGVTPGNGAAAVFLLLIVPVVSEAAARERISGTQGLVFSQPGVPASAVLWKAAAVSLFLLTLGAPMILRNLVVSPARSVTEVVGLAAIAGLAVGLGSLTSGGKLFTGLYLVVWYAALNGLPAADATGALGKSPDARVSLVYLAAGAAAVAAAVLRERATRQSAARLSLRGA